MPGLPETTNIHSDIAGHWGFLGKYMFQSSVVLKQVLVTLALAQIKSTIQPFIDQA
jgi:hypothetical protein